MTLNTLKGLLLAVAFCLAGSAAALAQPNCGDGGGKAATGDPIVIGAIAGRTGPDDMSSSTKSAKAYFDCVNANGGIHGRPIEYIVDDDQWNPELSSQLAMQLIDDKKAVLMVGNSSFVDCAVNTKLYDQKGVAVLAGVGVSRECYFSRNYAPVNAGIRAATLNVVEYGLSTYGLKKVVCIGPSIPNVGDWGCGGVVEMGRARGFEGISQLIDPSSADYTSAILQAASSNPDAIVLEVPKGISVALLQAAAEQGLADKIHFLSAASAYDITVPSALGQDWDGRFTAAMEFSDLNDTGADNRNWRAVLDAYGQPSDPRDNFGQAGYLSARFAVEVLDTLDPSKINRETVSEALRSARPFASDMLCSPWYFGAGDRHNANHTGRIAVTSAGGWKIAADCTASSDGELDDVRDYEKQLGLN